MDISATPHFHNERGVARVRIGVREFMCIGALPPFDHPHVYIDMGKRNEAICPYCATIFAFDPQLGAGCDPPDCAYRLEPEVIFEGPPLTAIESEVAREAVSAVPLAAPPVEFDQGPAKGVIGSFETEASLLRAMERFDALRLSEVQTFTPKMLERASGSSPLPWIILIGGLIGAGAGFAMETYANVVAYPLDIGGQPKFSWPSFVPIAFEIAVLFAVLSTIVGASVCMGLFRLYDPIDEYRSMRQAMRDRWVVAVRTPDPQRRARAREIFEDLGASDIEEISP